MFTLIPDVHGRSFWQDVKTLDQSALTADEPIIFLGDYHDPYPHERIDTTASLENFRQILAFRQSHPNVTLLLGNHDFSQYINTRAYPCRTDWEHLDEISALFAAHRDLFQVATIIEDEGQKYVLSHAGILRGWALHEVVLDVLGVNPDDVEAIVARLNELWQHKDPALYTILNMASFYRGGDDDYGSPVWADLDEWHAHKPEYEGYYQVFGHTQLAHHPVITPTYAAIDCRQVITCVEGQFTTCPKP